CTLTSRTSSAPTTSGTFCSRNACAPSSSGHKRSEQRSATSTRPARSLRSACFQSTAVATDKSDSLANAVATSWRTMGESEMASTAMRSSGSALPDAAFPACPLPLINDCCKRFWPRAHANGFYNFFYYSRVSIIMIVDTFDLCHFVLMRRIFMKLTSKSKNATTRRETLRLFGAGAVVLAGCSGEAQTDAGNGTGPMGSTTSGGSGGSGGATGSTSATTTSATGGGGSAGTTGAGGDVSGAGGATGGAGGSTGAGGA